MKSGEIYGFHDYCGMYFSGFLTLYLLGEARFRKSRSNIMSTFVVLEKWSYDLKQQQPLESRIVSEHASYQQAAFSATNVHPWDMNYTEWYVEIEKRKLI